jgi:hypothetical protein
MDSKDSVLEFGSLKEVPAEVLERVMEILREGGIRFKGCQLKVKIEGLHLADDGILEAENLNAIDVEVPRYYLTLNTFVRGDKTTYRDMVFVELYKGRPKIGDLVSEIRLFPDGRYRVHVQQDQYYKNPGEFVEGPRLMRSSVANPHQAIRRRVESLPGGGWSNSKKIIGGPIAEHYIQLPWGQDLKESDFQDVCDFADSMDLMGRGTFLRMLKHAPAALANEVYRQMRDQDRKKLPRRSKK